MLNNALKLHEMLKSVLYIFSTQIL